MKTKMNHQDKLKTKLILNPFAGKKRLDKEIETIRKILTSEKLDFELAFTQKPKDGIYLAQKAVEEGFNLIVAVGGDGTINEVVNGIIDFEEVILGIIPIGLGNDFAWMIGLGPKDIEKACKTLSNGTVKKIDVGVVNNRYFVNGVGIGFDAQVAKERLKYKGMLSGLGLYLYAVMKTLFKYKSIQANIKLDDKEININLLLIAIGVGKRCGGGFLLTPEAELDDGLFDVCVIQQIGKLKALCSLPKTLKGIHTTMPEVNMYRAKQIIVNLPVPLTGHVDGEIIEGNTYQIGLLPKKLKVMYPI
ncbi:MAG: diacylglycerol kinase family protein [bacterium]